MNKALFCYGTLQSPEVFGGITGLKLPSTKAVLTDYACFRVHRAEYPGIKPLAGAEVPGLVYQGVSANALKQLDRFEGEMYKRQLMPIKTDEGQAITAWCYVIRAHWLHCLTDEPWHFDTHAEAFIKRFRHNKNI
ncbi:MAG: gamma-glutamylcyclotransferase [Pseudomonadales bacterium]|nr:gamma-glutamylcyclotransferase [Pseudomonadales bacterium]